MADIAKLYAMDIGDFSAALESQLMTERRRKVGVFITLPRKAQVCSLDRSQLMHLHSSLLLDWMHFHTRCLVPIYRKVRRAEFNPEPYTTIVNNIQKSLEDGKSLKDRVSRQVLKDFKRAELKQDPLLWHWNIHHFHLGNFDPNLGYAEGTDDLLFVYADRQEAVILGIAKHDQIGELWLLDKLFYTAPDLLERFTLKDVIGISGPSDPSRKKLWKNLNFTHQYQGRLIHPPGLGVASSGHATRLVLSKNKLLQAISNHDRQLPYGAREVALASLRFDGSSVNVVLPNGQIMASQPLV
ncbi:hypothetical protein [Leisingera methylohalidivorans]|uniref:Uncharacterized protein n=1 Tax=Leisingera methylohalidivorans DSM 14336 TaxID=999552 RepID=V9VYX4_9RHOB|nr:hypothetical protein [Leisingera methylohalidivorans]AHD02959.1 hypothetical protein METH_06955 [Leisingera methylohalidivorans DSM 14336]